jgi:hypothetical protein
VYFFFPETSGCHLEEVDAIFLDSSNILETVSVASKTRRCSFGTNENDSGNGKHRVDIIERPEGA